jgi:hypothetical protein
MDLMNGELRNHLDPTAIRVLKKRLISGKITPQVFKDILRRQMVKYFFQVYRHPLIKSWEDWRKPAPKRLRGHGSATPRSKNDTLEMHDHKRF